MGPCSTRHLRPAIHCRWAKAFKLTSEVTLKSSSWRPGSNRWILVLTACALKPNFALQTHSLSHPTASQQKRCTVLSLPPLKDPQILRIRKQAKSLWTTQFFSPYSFFNVYAFFKCTNCKPVNLLTNYSFAVSFKSNIKLMLGLRNNYDKILITTYLNHNLIIGSCPVLAYSNAVSLKKLMKDISLARTSLNPRNLAVSLEQLIRTEWFSHWPFLWRLNQKAFAKQLSRTGGIRKCFRAFLFFIKSAA